MVRSQGISAAHIVPANMMELRASAALFAFIDERMSGVFEEDTPEAWCRSLAEGIASFCAARS